MTSGEVLRLLSRNQQPEQAGRLTSVVTSIEETMTGDAGRALAKTRNMVPKATRRDSPMEASNELARDADDDEELSSEAGEGVYLLHRNDEDRHPCKVQTKEKYRRRMHEVSLQNLMVRLVRNTIDAGLPCSCG